MTTNKEVKMIIFPCQFLYFLTIQYIYVCMYMYTHVATYVHAVLNDA